jgi:ribosomal protein S18 acetylase RimI-like enzyme
VNGAEPEVTVEIREARPDERPAAAAIAVAAFAQLGAHLAPDEREKLYARVRATTEAPDPGHVIVAVAGGRVVGSVVYNGPAAGQHPLFAADWAFFRSIGVDAAWGGRGIGRRLVEACIERARRDGAAWLGLYAADVNTVAVRLYRAMGFAEIGPAPSYWGVAYRVYGLDLSGG